MSKVDFSLDSVEMDQYRNDLLKLQSMLIDISESIDSIQQRLSDENLVKWHGNGKEQCTAFVTLIDRLASLIAGEPKSGITGIIKDSAGDDLISEGTNWEHFTMMDKSIEKEKKEIISKQNISPDEFKNFFLKNSMEMFNEICKSEK